LAQPLSNVAGWWLPRPRWGTTIFRKWPNPAKLWVVGGQAARGEGIGIPRSRYAIPRGEGRGIQSVIDNSFTFSKYSSVTGPLAGDLQLSSSPARADYPIPNSPEDGVGSAPTAAHHCKGCILPVAPAGRFLLGSSWSVSWPRSQPVLVALSIFKARQRTHSCAPL
jgi:hypothetical protein